MTLGWPLTEEQWLDFQGRIDRLVQNERAFANVCGATKLADKHRLRAGHIEAVNEILCEVKEAHGLDSRLFAFTWAEMKKVAS